MPEDPLGLAKLRQIGARAGTVARILDEAPVAASFEGEDETGAVRAVVDQSGMVTEVRLAKDWRRKMHRNDLGAMVLAAIDAAGGKALSAEAERIVGAVNAAGTFPESPATDRPPAEFAPDLGVGKRLRYLVDRASGEQSAVARNATPASVVGTSGGGHVTILFSGTQVVGVDIEDHEESNWTVMANAAEIESELADALRHGYAAAAARNVEHADATAELWTLTADARAFVDELFGARRSDRNGG